MTKRAWFASVVIFLVCWSLTTRGKYTCSGDEPHYLMVCQSLWADGDLDVRNNYAEGQSGRFGVAGLSMEQHVREDRHGAALPVHDIGLPLALLPMYVTATTLSSFAPESTLKRFRMNRGQFAYSLISLFIVGLVALAAGLTCAALRLGGSPPGAAAAIVIVLWLSPPILSNSFVVFPEAFALLATGLAVLVAVRHSCPTLRRDWILLACALGVLPWFHRKYALYALALLVAVAWQRRAQLAALRRTDRWLSIGLFLAPQIVLAAWSYEHWRNIGGPLVAQGHLFAWNGFTTGALGLLVDRENGLFVWAPIYLFLPAAWVLAGRHNGVWLVPVAYLFLVSSAHLQWWAGFSPAARFFVPLVPIFAWAGGVALRERRFRYACIALLVPQALICISGWQHARALWPQGNGHNAILASLLGAIAVPETILPSLRTLPGATLAAWAAVGSLVLLNVGILAGRPPAMPAAPQPTREADASAAADRASRSGK